MLQAVMTSPGQIEFNEVETPHAGPEEVLIKVKNIGICGSDRHVFHGTHPFTDYPIVQGHEVSGEIVEIGNRITGLEIGDPVTIEPQVVCGKCHPCTHGKYNLCEELNVMGFQTDGAASEYFAVDAGNITSLPKTMTYELGAMMEPLAVAVHAVNQAGSVEGLNICVIGAGPIGNLVAQAAKGLGAAKVMITDLSDARLEIARECGIDECVNTSVVDFGDALVEAFGPAKADVIYDCAGNDASIGEAIANARKGSFIVLVAVFTKPATVDLALLNDHELDLRSSMMYRHEDFLDAIVMTEEGRVQLTPLISAHFPFKDYAAAYQALDENPDTMMKVIIDMES